MDDLTAFIAARLDEDEEAMRRIEGRRWYACDDGHVEEPIEQWADGGDRLPNHHNTWSLVLDPERALREVEAKRAILARYEAMDDEGLYHGLSLAIVHLATAWSDHPDYKAEWVP